MFPGQIHLVPSPRNNLENPKKSMMRKCQDGSKHWNLWRAESYCQLRFSVCSAWKRTNFGVPHSLHSQTWAGILVDNIMQHRHLSRWRELGNNWRQNILSYLPFHPFLFQTSRLHSEDSLLHLLLFHGDWEGSLDLRRFWGVCRASTISFWELSLSILRIIFPLSWLLKLIWTNSLASASFTFALPLESGHISRGKLAHRLK